MFKEIARKLAFVWECIKAIVGWLSDLPDEWKDN
jgi:hypothetical protein